MIISKLMGTITLTPTMWMTYMMILIMITIITVLCAGLQTEQLILSSKDYIPVDRTEIAWYQEFIWRSCFLVCIDSLSLTAFELQGRPNIFLWSSNCCTQTLYELLQKKKNSKWNKISYIIWILFGSSYLLILNIYWLVTSKW